jgi:putative glutamine amidotransferase
LTPRIAIPMPHSTNREYGQRALPQYERAVALLGGEPVRLPLDGTPVEARQIIDSCDGVLLPGSGADVDPARFHQPRSQRCAAADARREQVDNLLLEDAYALAKPVLGICYGLQSLNVYRGGSLVQHIPEFLPPGVRAQVNHQAGKKVAVAHTVEIESDSLLADILSGDSRPRQSDRKLWLPVNSSHHQSADGIGEGLRIVARCPEDGIIEALEGTAPGHFVLSVQWHPERSVDDDDASRALFRALIKAAQRRR